MPGDIQYITYLASQRLIHLSFCSFSASVAEHFIGYHSTSDASVPFLAQPQVGKLVVAIGRQFTVQNLDQLYVLITSALPTTRRDMTCTVLKVT